VDKDNLLIVLEAAKMQRDAALARLVEAGKSGDEGLIKRAEEAVREWNEVISETEKDLRDAGP
jgi:hypothetical protein